MTALLFAAAVMLLLSSITPYLPFSGPLADLPSHFVLQYAIGAVLLLLLAFAFRAQGVTVALLGAALALNLVQLYPLMAGKAAVTEKPFRILQANVLFLSDKPGKLQDLIRKENPDIVLVSEVNSIFAKAFADMAGDYPHQAVLPQDDRAYGLAVLSKTPIETTVLHFGHDRIPAQEIRTSHDGKPLYIVSFHPANPAKNIALRNREFEGLAARLKAEKSAYKIVSGDFNATPYCHVMKKLLKETGMVQARQGAGPQGTWLSWAPSFLRIPIDHTIVTPNIGIARFRTGPSIDSDHLPTIADLSLDG